MSGRQNAIDDTGGLGWLTVTSGTETLVSSQYYVADGSDIIIFVLPVTASFGDTYIIAGVGSGGWVVTQNDGQSINFGVASTTPGSGGYLLAVNPNDTVGLVCVAGNTTWNVFTVVGNLTVV